MKITGEPSASSSTPSQHPIPQSGAEDHDPIYAAFLDTVREAAEHRQERRDREDRRTRLILRVSLVLLAIGVALAIAGITLWVVAHASGAPSDQQSQGSVTSICTGHPGGCATDVPLLTSTGRGRR